MPPAVGLPVHVSQALLLIQYWPLVSLHPAEKAACMSLRADTVLNWFFHVVNPSSVWDSLYVYLWLVYTCCIEGGMCGVVWCGVVWLLGDIVGMPQSSSRRSGVTAALFTKLPLPLLI